MKILLHMFQKRFAEDMVVAILLGSIKALSV